MDVEDYIAFRNMIETPPKSLLLGKVMNVYSEQQEEAQSKTDKISVALQLFFSDTADSYPRIWTHYVVPNYIAYKPLLKTKHGRPFGLSDCFSKLRAVAEPAPYGDQGRYSS